MTQRARWLAGWTVLVLAGALALAGAAARPGGIWLGVPSLLTCAGLVAAALAGAFWRRSAGGLGLGLLPVVAIVVTGPPIPGVGALTGPPLGALVLAALVVAVAHGRPVPRRLFFPVVCAIYVVAAGRVQVQVGPRGDEPHYLMVAESIVRDGDLSLEADYAEGRYRQFADGPLAPHYRVRGRGGEIYSLHAVGLSLLVLPAYALGGYPAASLFMAVLTALLALETRELVRRWTGRDSLAEGLGWAVALSPPLLHYAGLVFTEVPAALAVAIGLRRGRDALSWKPATACAVGSVLAFLPWLNVRYAPLAALLVAFALWHRPRPASAAGFLAPAVASALSSALYHYALYGFFDPRRVYGRRPELSWATLPEGLPGVLLDQEFGLLVYAPAFALALPGLFLLWRRDRRGAVVVWALVGVALLTASTWHMWRGGWNPPARFLVPLVPALAVAIAWGLARGVSAGAAMLIGWSLWTGLLGAAEPRLVHRDRDGTAPFFRAYSGAEEWTRLLPGYVLADPDRHRRAAVWGVALALAALWRRAPATPSGLAGASLGLLAAAAVASGLSLGRTGGRDAVRLVGRPALAVPGWMWTSAASGHWDATALDWGPLYEPHRHPAGAPIGYRLPLPPGRYRLVLIAEDLSPGTPTPHLEVRAESLSAPRRAQTARGRGGLAATFEVHDGEGAVTLLLGGGGPLLLKEMLVEAQPFPPDRV
jgi:hypothetical protein